MRIGVSERLPYTYGQPMTCRVWNLSSTYNGRSEGQGVTKRIP